MTITLCTPPKIIIKSYLFCILKLFVEKFGDFKVKLTIKDFIKVPKMGQGFCNTLGTSVIYNSILSYPFKITCPGKSS